MVERLHSNIREMVPCLEETSSLNENLDKVIDLIRNDKLSR